MHLYDSELYMQDVCAVASMIEVQELAGASVLISGGTGMIGSFLIDALLYANKNYGAQTEIYILGRNEDKARARFADYADCQKFHFIKQDLRRAIPTRLPMRVIRLERSPQMYLEPSICSTMRRRQAVNGLYFYLRLKSTEKTVEIPINSQRIILAISTATRCVPDIRRASVPERHCARHTANKRRWML